MDLPVKKTFATISPLVELILAVVLGGLLTLVFAAIFPVVSSTVRWAFFAATSVIVFLVVSWLVRRR